MRLLASCAGCACSLGETQKATIHVCFLLICDKFVHTRDRDVSIGFRSVTLLLFRALADGGGVHTGAGAVGRGRDAAA